MTISRRQFGERRSVAVLALLAYAPLFLVNRGQVVTDTKLYLATAPADLLSNAATAWDSRQFAGFVPHQNIGYLWPSGPYFWLTEFIGLPDWLSQRVWLGSLMCLAGWGVYRCARRFQLTAEAALIAAIAYQCSPYVLSYISRSSVLLLPWTALGWLVALTLKGTDNKPSPEFTRKAWVHLWPWRIPAAIALVVVSIGGINATALVMITPAPLIVLVDRLRHHETSFRLAVGFAVRTVCLSLAVSLWWLTAIAVQGRYGAKVLSYSETLEAVSSTSTASEILRGLGHWLNYVMGQTVIGTTAAVDYASRNFLLLTGYCIVILSVLGLVISKWRYRSMASLFIVVGTIAASGVHPIDNPSPLMTPLADNSDSVFALALRSSTRATPLVLFGLALGLGLLWQHVNSKYLSTLFETASLVGIVALLMLNFPALITGDLLDPAMTRVSDLPDDFIAATTALNDSNQSGRVLVVPGSEFGVFDWGYTMDPPQVGLLNQPILTRDLLPLGGSGAMDLAYAFDDKLQTGTLRPSAVAPIAKLLGITDIWLSKDHNYRRYNTVSPTELGNLLSAAPGITVNDVIGEANTSAKLFRVLDSAGIARIKTSMALVDGNGDGLISAAATGLLTGDEATIYGSSLKTAQQDKFLNQGATVIVTDSNRARARQWRGSRDTVGATEALDGTRLTYASDPADRRLPLFDDTDAGMLPGSKSWTVLTGPMRATASAYGSNTSYLPEFRPNNAIDGSIATAWRVADHANPIGHSISVKSDSAFSQVRLVQPIETAEDRWITKVRITTDYGTDVVQELTPVSRQREGQIIALANPSKFVQITILDIGWNKSKGSNNLIPVGFAEIDTGQQPTTESILVPNLLTSRVVAPMRLNFVFERQRVRAVDSWRSDPEVSLSRDFQLSNRNYLRVVATVSANLRMSDTQINTLLGTTTTSNQHLVGSVINAGWAATDGNNSTGWRSASGSPLNSELAVRVVRGASQLRVVFDGGANLSGINQVEVSNGRERKVIDVNNRTEVAFAFPMRAGDTIKIRITKVTPRFFTDIRTGDQTLAAVGILQIESEGIEQLTPRAVNVTCSPDYISVDGRPVPISFSASVDEVLMGSAIEATTCDPNILQLEAGTHSLRSIDSTTSAIVPELVALVSPKPNSVSPALPLQVVGHNSSQKLKFTGCDIPCAVVFGESFSDAWNARLNNLPLADQIMMDGGFNGWMLDGNQSAGTISLRFEPQRWVTIALFLSALSVVICIGMVALTSSRSRNNIGSSSDAPTIAQTRSVSWTVALPTLPRAIALACGFAAVTALVTEPKYGLAMLLITLVSINTARRWVSWLGLAILTYELARIFNNYRDLTPLVNFDWPRFSDIGHRPIIFALLLVTYGLSGRPQNGVADTINGSDGASDATNNN